MTNRLFFPKVVTLYLTKLYQKHLLSEPAIVGSEKHE